ncbi:hypothetical protein LG943_13165 [Streptomonospora sp. S1-112]|uniref:Uncharacterized protein n=1 Tax=Streptomonospora mangrovi TaxID=2883123 RepID=A0A9X3SES5_9ACTN|nr:hypothetical protein [Streptomonospora mangrovi]MDA0565257.1 hypothetical protein [Streptomonospora mangrovi]
MTVLPPYPMQRLRLSALRHPAKAAAAAASLAAPAGAAVFAVFALVVPGTMAVAWPWAALLGGVLTGVSTGVCCLAALRRVRRAGAVDPATDARTLHAAERVLKEGRPSGVPDVDRLAAALLEASVRGPHPALTLALFVPIALADGALLAVALAEGDTRQAVFFGVLAVSMVGLGVFSAVAGARERRRRRWLEPAFGLPRR